MAKVQNLSRYETIQAYAAKRREGLQQGLGRSDSIRSIMASNITQTAAKQVQLSEQLIRSRISAAAKAKAAALNKLA